VLEGPDAGGLGFEPSTGDDDMAAALLGEEDSRPRRSSAPSPKPKRGLFGRGKSKGGDADEAKRHEGAGVSGWLGVGNDFDARH